MSIERMDRTVSGGFKIADQSSANDLLQMEARNKGTVSSALRGR